MQKEVYADNVDVNGEAHETVGENIRNGAKSPEAVAKALQSEDITFDMQALMNVLPFMDSTKKIVRVRGSIKNGLTEGADVALIVENFIVPLTTWYGMLLGEFRGGQSTNITLRYDNGNGGIGLLLPKDSEIIFTLYVCVNK